MTQLPGKVQIQYDNHRGELTDRVIFPVSIRFGTSEWHPKPTWLLNAYCYERKANRDFAIDHIITWSPVE